MQFWKSGNRVIGINYDECAENPREWYEGSDDEWHIVCMKNRRYSLPHEKELESSEGCQVVPLSFFAHGNTALVIGEHDDWDVCPCGYAWRKSNETETDSLQGELDIYNMWANGDVMFATLYDLNGNVLDSIGGLFYDTCEEAAKSAANDYFDFDWENAEETKPCYTMHFE